MELVRYDFTETRTIGRLAIDGVFFCFTLEDGVREKKIPRITAIPYGIYQVAVTMSRRFKRMMPLLMNVPDFDGIRIHCGNTFEDTSGCILVGMNRTPNTIQDSRRAFDALMARMDAIPPAEPVTIEITKAPATFDANGDLV